MRDQPAMLRSTTGETMTLEGVAAKGRVRGLLFELDVEQRYRNPHETNVEAVYTFPLPSEAVLLDLDVVLNGRKLVATVVEKREAERDYEKAIDKGDTAIMLERAGDGLCTLNLGNLMAGEKATIRYRYAQLLRFEHGSVRLAVPTVIAPRYGDPQDAGLQPHQVPANDLAVAYPFSLSIDLEGEIAGGTIASPSHPLAMVATANGMRVGLARGAFLDRDFVLAVSGLAGKSLAVVARDGERFVALASFCADLPREATERPLAVKLLVDCSGSMNGDSIDAARRALHRILASLEPADRFSYSRFGSQVVHETEGFVPGSEVNVRAAAERVGRTEADLGGTEMTGALQQVFAIGGRDGAAEVLLLTDGEVWNADHLIAEARGSRQRVFVVGIGSAPAEGVLRRLAEATGGACEFVAPNEDAEGAILRMFSRLRAPRVDRAEVSWPIAPAWATPLPSGLFGGETIHAFAGFDRAPEGAIALALHAKSGEPPLTATSHLGGEIVEDRTLARIAAARRIESASEEDRLRLALEYGLLTARTNLLVVHERAEGEKAADLPQLAQVAQMHAAGWHGVGSLVIHSAGPVDFAALDMPSARMRISAKAMALFTRESANLLPDFDTLAPAGSPAWGGDGLDPVFESSMRAALEGLRTLGADVWPTTFDGLRMLGVPDHVVEQLSALADASASEGEVVAAFLVALVEWNGGAGNAPVFARHEARAIRHRFGARASDPGVKVAVELALDVWLATDLPLHATQDAPMASG